jgi:hypothetical protein
MTTTMKYFKIGIYYLLLSISRVKLIYYLYLYIFILYCFIEFFDE